MKKLRMHSPNYVEENIAQLADLFPNCVTEARTENGASRMSVDFDLLRQELSTTIVEGPQERYQLNWPGKRKSLFSANTPVSKTLRPCRQESLNFDSTENLFIEGDNLDALKLLQESYLGQVKMIYIDPPYNTGKDFIYSDSFAESSLKYLLNSGQKDRMGNRLVANSESNGRFHSDWLSMMYPRLKLARNLLRNDGVIFISIDDTEQASLKRICDEIFGEENLVACLNWQTKKGAQGMQTRNMIVANHEFVLVYARNSEEFRFLGEERSEQGFSNPDNDPRGPWKRQYIQRLGQNLPKRSIVNPENGMRFCCETPYMQENLDRWVREGRIIFPTSTDRYPARKEFLSEYAGNKQLVTSLGLHATKSTTEKLYNLFDKKKIFTNPKPDSLLHYLFKVTTSPQDIILDFFAGSATTAHAVIQLNADDGGKRKFIMVQLAESCAEDSEAFKAGYTTIADIGKERIRRAGKKIKGEHPENAPSLDTGFRVLKVDSSNMADVYYTPSELQQEHIDTQAENIKSGRSAEDLLFQVLLNSGVGLTLPIVRESIQGREVFFVRGNELVACFETQGRISEELCRELAQRQPLRVVFRDSGFASDSVKINTEQIFKMLSPHTELRII